ncbi:MAG: polyhydroxyalkanoate synthesis repressor PhaR [Panacagrimonas sp.]
MAEPYLIKKYSSRRLYDVAAGSFLTLGDIDRLIRQGRRIKAIDAKGKDITRSVLLQILTEREEGGEPLLSTDILHEMVRLYGNAMQGPFGRFLEDGMAVMRKQQEVWHNTVPDAFRQGTVGIVSKLMEQQGAWWNAAQKAWFGKAEEESEKPAAETPPKRRRK